jgi:hypothetical protein
VSVKLKKRREEIMEQLKTKKKIMKMYRGADKFLARPTSRCISFDCKNISFDSSIHT